ncbi:hypothetical protein NA56DRAFT_705352 [Hyaloscypha hepaticicola]|uniref:Uncharacterized protein n=1 Tax=Hyaloscypha hepaticicola TaxID=2082293 RepID=A0A2J6Q054_9HELO|nr:hypothetical protein NA56DRAFT_705352 [Hyaloscypha hepaticicola]
MASQDMQAPAISEHQEPAMINNISPSPKSLTELLKAERLSRTYKQSRKFYERIELEIEHAEEELQIFDDEMKQRGIEGLDAVKASGLSAELMEAYNAFCESLNGPNGSQPRDGFSILCEQPHGGLYFEYDPEFKLFKEFVEPERDVDVEFVAPDGDLEEKLDRETEIVLTENLEMALKMNIEEHSEETAEEDSEIDSEVVSESNSESNSQSDSEMDFKGITDDGYNARNYRCEASLSLGGSQREEHPKLYRLAIQAAKTGSEAAMEMLIRLPSMNAVFSGWLLEYEFAEELKDEFLLSRRWVFRQAKKIDELGSV